MINFTPKNEKDLLEIALHKAQEKHLISDDDEVIQTILNYYQDIENQYVHTLNTIAHIGETIENDIGTGYNNTSIETANDTGLENFGELWNIKRYPAKHNIVNLIFTLDKVYEANTDTYSEYKIPAGTQVTNNNNNSIIYETIYDAYISKGETSTSVIAQSVEAGTLTSVPALYLDTIINKLTLDDINNTHYNDYEVNVINNERSEGGNDGESLENYRNRLLNDRFKSYERGTYAQINNFLLNYDYLDDYRLIPHYAGLGTYKLIIRTIEENKEQFIEELREALKIVEYAYDDYGIIETANTQIHNHIECTIRIPDTFSDSEKQNIRLKTKYIILTYINGGYLPTNEYYKGLRIGEDFNTYKCGIFLNQYINILEEVTWKENSDYYINEDETLMTKLENITVNIIGERL